MLLEQAIREEKTPCWRRTRALLHPLGREALARYLNGGRVIFRVARAADIGRAVAFAKRPDGMKPVIAGGEEAWVVAQESPTTTSPVLLDALANLPVSFDSNRLATRQRRFLLHRAGVRIGFTQFGESHNARKIRQLAGNAVAHGLPAEAALAALTCETGRDLRPQRESRAHCAWPDRRPRTLERRPAGSDLGCRSGLDQGPRHRDAFAADRTARPVRNRLMGRRTE